MSKDKNRLFTQIFDDIIRCPDLTSHDFRLYSLLMSYCLKKTDGPRVCRLTKGALAGQLRVAERTIFDSLRNLERLGLISISYRDNDKRYPVYTLVEPPPINCPERLLSNRAVDAIAYVEESGGVKELQRRSFKQRKGPKRTGRPAGWASGNLDAVADDAVADGLGDALGDGPGPQVPEMASLDDSPSGSTLPDPRAVHCPTLGQDTAIGMAVSCPTYGSVLPDLWQCTARPSGSTLLPCTDELEDVLGDRPNGLRTRSDLRPLASLGPAPEPPEAQHSEEKHREFRAAPNEDLDAPYGAPEEDTMGMSKEELAALRARQKALRPGARGQVSDLKRAENKPTKRDGGPLSAETQEIYDQITPEPETVGEVPKNPWQIYTHFAKAVRARYPQAQAPMAPGGKDMKWGSDLKNRFSRVQIYEMIQVLVLDYENITKARIWLKGTKTSHPSYEQLYMNADALLTYIGIGVVAPPAVRFSPYADDYAKRHNKGSTETADGPSTPEDDADAIRRAALSAYQDSGDRS